MPRALRSLVVGDGPATLARVLDRRVVAGRAQSDDGGEGRPGGTALDDTGFTHCEDTGGSAWAVQQISERA